MKKFLLLIPFTVLFTACSLNFPASQTQPTPTSSSTPSPTLIACPADAKVCPDGSSVGRSGPDCTFAACPNSQSPSVSSPAPTSTKQLTVSDATRLVSQQPEVKAWYALFTGPGQTSPATGGEPVIAEEGTLNGEYTIHVYEQTPDHTATFNWYYVNMKTGAVRKEFN